MQEIISGKYTIKQIFKDHWNDFLSRHQPSQHVITAVNKMLSCRDPEKLGFHKYVCPNHPEQVTIIPHSCKSKFCNVCGAYQTDKWLNKALSFFPNTTYYHITFTIPDYLWYFFRNNLKLLDFLFKASSEVILEWFQERGITPAICCALHTFGKQVNFNSHIHMIVSAGGLLMKKGKSYWKNISFIPYKKMLPVRWKTVLLKYLKPFLNSELKELLYHLNWYVHVNMRVLDLQFTCKYIGRYSKKPPLAETRITHYDGQFITFSYKERSNPDITFTKLHWEEFISRLIQHILPAQFRVIRYYGLLANRLKKNFQKIVSKLLKKVKTFLTNLPWRLRQLLFKKIDPLICKVCGEEMILKEFAFPSPAGGLVHKYF